MDTKEKVNNLMYTLKGKKITILGHDNIDVDAALSGILMSRLLDFLKIENEFCILEKVKENDTYRIIKESIGIDIKKWECKKESKDRNLLLLDHYETIHKGNVIACIDHHPTSKKNNYSFTYIRNSCSTTYLIYELMKEVDYNISREEAKMIVASMLIDTVAFKSSKTIEKEVDIAKKISKKYNVDYNLFEKYALSLTPIDKLSIEEIITNGQKWYKYGCYKVGSSYIQLDGLPKDSVLDTWISAIKEKRKITSSDMLVFIILDIKSNKTYEYRITSKDTSIFIKKGILSRGKDIMPEIEKKYTKTRPII